MAHFRGKVQGSRGEASRLGTKASGLSTEAASWDGKIVVDLHYNEETGKDEFIVRQEPHEGRGVSEHIAKGILGAVTNERTVK